MKSSAVANSNIAFVKYWGKRDTQLMTPMNSSISMTMDGLQTHTTIEFAKDLGNDVLLNGKKEDGKSLEKIVTHIQRIKALASSDLPFRMESENNFPTAAGLASSASGFAALTVAAADALGLELDGRQLSILSRQGSGSSCRSIFGGYVEWHAGDSSESSYAEQIADEDYFEIRNLIAIVDAAEKKISSRAGMATTVENCPLYGARLDAVQQTLKDMRRGILEKDFSLTGATTEFDMYLMHATMMTTRPALLYWAPGTVSILRAVGDWRNEGLEAYCTIDAGPNVHVLTLPENQREVEKRLGGIQGVSDIIKTRPGKGAQVVKEGLF